MQDYVNRASGLRNVFGCSVYDYVDRTGSTVIIGIASRDWRQRRQRRNQEVRRKRVAARRSGRGAREQEEEDDQGRSEEKRRPETREEGAKAAMRQEQ